MFGHMLNGFGGPLVMLVFWAALIAAVVYLVRLIPLGSQQGEEFPEPLPQEILKRRYAAGDIEREEYERIKSDLSS